MIKNDTAGAGNLKAIREREQATIAAELVAKAEEIARERYGVKLDDWKKLHKAVWFLVIDNEGVIEKMAVMKPINRHILSYASTKLEDDGLYSFLEQCMRECWIDGDDELLEDDEYFIPAAMKFNKMLEGKKAAFVKY
jgi:hypothetical protein